MIRYHLVNSRFSLQKICCIIKLQHNTQLGLPAANFLSVARLTLRKPAILAPESA